MNSKKQLLYVEDDVIAGRLRVRQMEDAGFTVEWVRDGRSALGALGRSRPDVVLLDLLLGDMDGIQVLEKIRAQPQNAQLPVVVLANSYVPQLIRDAEATGTYCTIKAETKPKRLAEILQNAALRHPIEAEGDSPAAKFFAQFAPPATATKALSPLEEIKQNGPEWKKALAQMHQDLLKARDPRTQTAILSEMGRRVHGIGSVTALAENTATARSAAAFEVLLGDLAARPQDLTFSPLRTIGQSVNLLGHLLLRPAPSGEQSSASARILAVDDELFSRTAVAKALERVSLPCDSLEDPQVASEKVKTEKYDLAVLDVDMPGLNGFDLCRNLRRSGPNWNTPVIFVTMLDGMESRMKSAQSGGTDFIAKPFLSIELGVKVLNLILQKRLDLDDRNLGSFVAAG